MDLELHGKRAIVTGGSMGIGRAVARQLALEGADLVVAARGRDTLGEAAARIAEEAGRMVVPFRVDTGDDASVRAMVDHAVAA